MPLNLQTQAEATQSCISEASPNWAPWIQDMPATPEGVRKALASVTENIEENGLSEDFSGEVEIVLAEILNNIVEHAYQETGQGRIELSLTLTPESWLEVCITDQGKAMPNGELPFPDLANIDAARQDLPEGGFGWNLIHTLTEDLKYSRVDNTNNLSFRMRAS
ncbi:MAG: ATP-binding protein [Mangrovicoccus sp.]